MELLESMKEYHYSGVQISTDFRYQTFKMGSGMEEIPSGT